MQIICPKCKHVHHFNRKQLKKKRGDIICSQCKHQFNTQISISKRPQPQVKDLPLPDVKIPEIPTLIKVRDQVNNENEEFDKPVAETYDWQKTTSAYRPEGWLIASIFGLLLLAFQVYYFKGYALSQNPQIRPWLATLSAYIHYPLPEYHKPREFTTISSSLEQSDDGHYRLQVSLINQADFRQPPPYLLLTLQNLYGRVFAQRIFSAQEYLGKTNANMTIASSASLDIALLFAAPAQEIGGYTLELK